MTSKDSTAIAAESVRFSDLFRKGLFTVPWHQRYYDWDVANVQALLHDLDEANKEQRLCYFLGTVMTVKIEKNLWEINDGQQRMVTVSLIYAALCRRFSQITKDSLREGLAITVMFDKELTGETCFENVNIYKPRLEPPVNDRVRFQQMLRGLTFGTNGKLTKAWNVIDDYFGPTNKGDHWQQFFDFIEKRLEVAWLQVPKVIDPNAVYETINCRGKQLDDLDLIRNYIYSHFNDKKDKQRRTTVHDCLEKIRDVFPTSPQKKAAEYMRCHLQCRFGFLHSNNFYRDVRQAIREQRGLKNNNTLKIVDFVFNLTQDLANSNDLELYRTLNANNNIPEILRTFEVKAKTGSSSRKTTVLLQELNRYKVIQPIVFSLMKKYYDETDGRKRLRIARQIHMNISRLATFVLRTAFVSPKFEPSHFETEFSNFASFIMSSNDIPDKEFVKFLMDCDRSEYSVLDDLIFQEKMSKISMKDSRKIKLLLVGLNRHGRRDASILNIDQCSVEHILPVSSVHWDGWKGFRENSHDNWIHRIGNLTLISDTDNKPGKKYNASFTKKLKTYKESSVALTRELEKHSDWNPKIIMERQQEMAEMAVQVWTF